MHETTRPVLVGHDMRLPCHRRRQCSPFRPGGCHGVRFGRVTRVIFRFIVLIIVVAGVFSHGVCVVVVRPNSVFAVRVTVRDLVARSRRTFSGALGHGEACHLPPAHLSGGNAEGMLCTRTISAQFQILHDLHHFGNLCMTCARARALEAGAQSRVF
jgi:hypothetical protein